MVRVDEGSEAPTITSRNETSDGVTTAIMVRESIFQSRDCTIYDMRSGHLGFGIEACSAQLTGNRGFVLLQMIPGTESLRVFPKIIDIWL
jgi:hypothetical protein